MRYSCSAQQCLQQRDNTNYCTDRSPGTACSPKRLYCRVPGVPCRLKTAPVAPQGWTRLLNDFEATTNHQQLEDMALRAILR